ncbi:MAG: carotenoid biosynthesis protein [Bacteroidia bacterium]|nr:carotenoid biosynthesis protein [Bacteroidia bacterium]
MERTQRGVTIAVLILVIFHQVGLVGLHLSSTKDVFIQLVPMNLLLSALLLSIFHQKWSISFGIVIFVIFWAGYLIELVGVKTGLIFGVYQYGTALGPKIAGVPPMIGLNWLLLTYSTGVIARKAFRPLWARILFACVLMVLLDLLIEPMAIRFDFWHWDSGEIPLQNFVAWFLTAALMQTGFQTLDQDIKNPLAYPFYLVQIGFFAVFFLVEHAF